MKRADRLLSKEELDVLRTTELLVDALGDLDLEQLIVVIWVDIHGLTEPEAAGQFTWVTRLPYDRDRIHTIRTTAHGRIRRFVHRQLEEAVA